MPVAWTAEDHRPAQDSEDGITFWFRDEVGGSANITI